jgi:hypothetical protein
LRGNIATNNHQFEAIKILSIWLVQSVAGKISNWILQNGNMVHSQSTIRILRSYTHVQHWLLSFTIWCRKKQKKKLLDVLNIYYPAISIDLSWYHSNDQSVEQSVRDFSVFQASLNLSRDCDRCNLDWWGKWTLSFVGGPLNTIQSVYDYWVLGANASCFLEILYGKICEALFFIT